MLLRLPILLYRLGLGRVFGFIPILILTTRGRTTGAPRYAVLEYRRHGSKVYVISAWGARPNWYRNLLAHPFVAVRAGGQRYGARAAVVDDHSEALRALSLFRKETPAIFDAVISRLSDVSAAEITPRKLPDISRQITIIRIDPTNEPTPPPLPSNLAWVLPVSVVFSTALAVSAVMNLSRRRS